MAVPLSVDDAFTVGVSFDLLGGYLLGRGLLASAMDIRLRNTHQAIVGSSFNAAQAVSQIESRADAFVGLGSLAIGFLLQAGGYVALIAGAEVDTGVVRAFVAAALAFAVGVGAFLALRELRWGRVKALAVGVARADPATGRMDPEPDAKTLIDLGVQLGFPGVGVTAQGMTDVNAWAKKHFGVRVFTRYPISFPAPPAR